tara:strand:- start:8 stop:424 length:417 start_codon:yes stop_codon:yes gene_type:complete
MIKQYDINSFEQLSSVALELLRCSDNRIFAIYGNMGVGKTTLIKYMCNHLNVCDSISSPTFSVVNEYVDINSEKIFHFDFYRLNNLEEADKLGLDTYFSSGNICFLEWPNLINSILPDKHHVIEIVEKNNKRELFLLK